MDRKIPRHIIVDTRGLLSRNHPPTTEQLRELEAAVLESLIALDEGRPWEPVDDLLTDTWGSSFDGDD